MRDTAGEEASGEVPDAHINEWLRRERIRLCNEWDLVPAEDLRNANHLNETIIAGLQARLQRKRGRHSLVRKQRHPVPTVG